MVFYPDLPQQIDVSSNSRHFSVPAPRQNCGGQSDGICDLESRGLLSFPQTARADAEHRGQWFSSSLLSRHSTIF